MCNLQNKAKQFQHCSDSGLGLVSLFVKQEFGVGTSGLMPALVEFFRLEGLLRPNPTISPSSPANFHVDAAWGDDAEWLYSCLSIQCVYGLSVSTSSECRPPPAMAAAEAQLLCGCNLFTGYCL